MVETRLARIHDIDDVARLLSFIRMKEVSSEEIELLFTDMVSSRYSDIMLITDNNTPIGQASLNCVLKLNRIECRIDDVIISPSFQGGGLGRKLINACSQWAWEKGCYKIEFTSRAERTIAHKFYQKLGYERRDSHIYTKFSPEIDYVKTEVV